MPALEMAQETGKVLRWLKRDGEPVAKGEPLMEIETDKVTVEIEAPASGVVGGIRVREGESVPVGQTIAWVLEQGEQVPSEIPAVQSGRARKDELPSTEQKIEWQPGLANPPSIISASPLALQIAREHGIDLSQIPEKGRRIEKADVLGYLEKRDGGSRKGLGKTRRLSPASPKARRIALENGFDISGLFGSGPDQAVLAADVQAAQATAPLVSQGASVGTIWRVMAERMTTAWTTVPHFYLTREVGAAALIEMRARIGPLVEKRDKVKPTFTDILVKVIATCLRSHPQVNASYVSGGFRLNKSIHVGIAVAVEDGLIVPVVKNADTLGIAEIALARQDLVARAKEGKLRLPDITGGTFTLSNLGMFGVDAFNAIVNSPQAAILAVGRIADRVVAVGGQPAVRPTMIITLSCDHRVVDGARGARFLEDVADLIEEPWGLLA